MSKVSCEIVKDLLPLYHDEVCSDESRKMIEEHLADCDSCKNELNRIGADIGIAKGNVEKNLEEGNAIKKFAVSLKHSRAKAFISGLIITAMLSAIVFLAFTWSIVNVPTDVIKVTDACQLADGRIAYHIELTDGYELDRIKFNMDEKGNFYMSPKRPVIKKKPVVSEAGFGNMYYTSGDFLQSVYRDKYGKDAEIKALYWGTPKHGILIWKKGMDLPKASEKLETFFKGETSTYMPY